MEKEKFSFNESFIKKEFQEMRAIMDRMMAQFGAQMGFYELDPEIVGVYNECVKLFNTLEMDALVYARDQDRFNSDVMHELKLSKERDQILIGMVKDLTDQVKKLTSKKGGE